MYRFYWTAAFKRTRYARTLPPNSANINLQQLMCWTDIYSKVTCLIEVKKKVRTERRRKNACKHISHTHTRSNKKMKWDVTYGNWWQWLRGLYTWYIVRMNRFIAVYKYYIANIAYIRATDSQFCDCWKSIDLLNFSWAKEL